MTKSEAIKTIELLYPADSYSRRVKEAGMELLLEAIALNWRSLPDGIIKGYAMLCKQKELSNGVIKR